MASRKGNSDEAKEILQKFKIENPLLIERLKLHQSHYRTDSSANYTLATSQKSNHNCDRVYSRTPPNMLNQCNDVSSNAVSMVIGSSEDKVIHDQIHHERGPVKSSNELLNSIVFLDLLHKGDRDRTETETRSLDNNITSNNTSGLSNMNIENSIAAMEVDELITTSHQRSICPKNIQIEDDERMDDSGDSDIAEALTQVIEEFSIENHNTGSDTMSLDEEFISEVVNEINEELVCGTGNINDIVLTPPLGFRDE